MGGMPISGGMGGMGSRGGIGGMLAAEAMPEKGAMGGMPIIGGRGGMGSIGGIDGMMATEAMPGHDEDAASMPPTRGADACMPGEARPSKAPSVAPNSILGASPAPVRHEAVSLAAARRQAAAQPRSPQQAASLAAALQQAACFHGHATPWRGGACPRGSGAGASRRAVAAATVAR